MGAQIIRQPDGLFAVFSSYSDTIVVTDATEEDILAYFVSLAIQDTTRRVAHLLEQVRSGHPDEAYHQFALTWEEAVAMDREHGGHVWTDSPTDGTEPGQPRAIQSAEARSTGVPHPGSPGASRPPPRES